MFLYILILIIIALCFYSFLVEPYNIKIKKIPIYLKNLPKSFQGETILQISDTHIKSFGKIEKKVLGLIKKINSDYIVITGDLVDHTTQSIKPCYKFFQKLTGFYDSQNIFVIFGNHIHANKHVNNHVLGDALRSLGINLLINENLKIKKRDGFLNIIGVDDPRTGHDDIEKAFKGIHNSDPNIFLSHCLEIKDKITTEDVDIILTGHTHGGQVKIPFIPAFWVPNIYKGKYLSGMYKINSLPIYINPGVSTTQLPVRFNARPEITLFTLNKKVN